MIKLENNDCINIDGDLYSMKGIGLIKKYNSYIGFDNIENPRKSFMVDCCEIEELYEALKAGCKTNYILVSNIIINCEKVEKLYIQSAKDELKNQLGYALNIVLQGEEEHGFRNVEIFFTSHIDAERSYHAIEYKVADIKNQQTMHDLIN